MDRPIIWFIDEDEDQVRTYVRQLTHLLPSTIEVRGMQPLRRKGDYFQTVLADPNTACILIDQKLKGTGANYLGIELARELRAINTKVPIYILTNYADEADQYRGSEWSVEDILAKGDLLDSEWAKINIPRMVRKIDVYTDILADREHRFNDLVRKSLTSELSDEETQELDNLQFERLAPRLAVELQQLNQLDHDVQRYRELLRGLKDSTLDGSVSDPDADNAHK